MQRKKITVIGLGLIGGSICKSLKDKHDVFGLDLSEDIIEEALNCGCIQGVGGIEDADIVIAATPPKAIVGTILSVIPHMKENSVIIDVCGVKEFFSRELNGFFEEILNKNDVKSESIKNKKITYIGCHPMAGKEKFGFRFSDERLFKGKDFIIAAEEKKENDKTAVETVEQLAKDMGFARITKCTPHHHDKVIAYTSQLAHIVSSCYVKSEILPYVEGYCGGSFQDMTRVATLDKEMWADLFLMNKENIISETELLVKNLTDFVTALKTGDKKTVMNEF
ncbi:MAG: prephenate dehydrogenase [Ruminococcus sp.]|jgi:prephenate dehydrogenase|nr:prephenate dehydrogenase [Ruminococcus sp.]